MSKKIIFIGLLSIIFLLSCSHKSSPTEPQETADLSVNMLLKPAKENGYNVTRVHVRISRSTFVDSMDLTINGESASGTFTDLKVGTYQIEVWVYEDTTLIATGSGTGEVKAGQTVNVTITVTFLTGNLGVTVNWGNDYIIYIKPYIAPNYLSRQGDIFIKRSLADEPIRLTNLGTITHAKISPDKKKIAFISEDNNQEYYIYVMNIDGTNIQKLNNAKVFGNHCWGSGLAWSPNSKSIIFNQGTQLMKYILKNHTITKIADAPSGRNFRESDWSPSGDKICALTIGSWAYNSEIVVMDTTGKNMKVVVQDEPGALNSPSFSPDGTKIVYSYDVSGHEESSGKQLDACIFIIDVDGTNKINISKTLKPNNYNDHSPRWSPDGNVILFYQRGIDNPENMSIVRINTNGANRYIINDGFYKPDWK